MNVRMNLWWASLFLGLSLAQSTPAQSPPQTFPALPAPQLAPTGYTLDNLVQLGLTQNPALQQAGLSISAAQGKAFQSGLYPNPTFSFSADELGDKTGPAGILTPQVSQELVTGGKLRLNRAIAGREVDQSTLALQSQRYFLLTTIRQGYFEVLAYQRRVEILTELVKLAKKSQESAELLLKGKQIAELDVLPFQLELDRLTAELEAAQREGMAAWRRLAASMGVPNLPKSPLVGSLDIPLPEFDFDPLRDFVLDAHPEVSFAKVGIAKAELAVKRAEVEKIPNVTVGAGYTRQNQNRSDDWLFGVSVPIPAFNRNQGNVQAARAELGRAIFELARVQNDLSGRLATAYGQFSAAKQRADRYRTSILPTATRSYQLSLTAFKGGQFEYLRVVQAQRAVAEANLEYIRALSDAWKAASEIAGLTLQENWPAQVAKK